MKLIVESGATKTDWCALRGNGSVERMKGPGMNVATQPFEDVKAILLDAVKQLPEEPVSEIHFYAAGLISSGEAVPEAAKNLHAALMTIWPDAEKEYASDLLDAARSVCGHAPGIAAIMGTGSNSCFYDGKDIVKNVRSCGFILGDEGGGASLGRDFMADFLKGLMPEELQKEFSAEYTVDYMTVVKNVYRGNAPSKYLGSFAPFIMDRYEKYDYVRELADRNFRRFIERALLQYDVEKYPVGVVGGFGYAHREIFTRIAAEYGIRFSTLIPTPMDGLIEYHK